MLTVSSYFDGDFISPDSDVHPMGIYIDDFSMLEMMQVLHDEVRMPGDASDDLVRAIGSVLRIKLTRLISQRMPERSLTAKPRNIDLAMIQNVIQSNSGGVPTTTELAALCNTSRRSLLRLFRSATGKTPSRYIEETRLNRAKMLLATSKMTLKQIAYEAGYSTASYFSSQFKCMTGLTPSAFRKKARRQDDFIQRPESPAGRRPLVSNCR
jgi:AraC family transcriptional regulator